MLAQQIAKWQAQLQTFILRGHCAQANTAKTGVLPTTLHSRSRPSAQPAMEANYLNVCVSARQRG